jgi:hypothetical protein
MVTSPIDHDPAEPPVGSGCGARSFTRGVNTPHRTRRFCQSHLDDDLDLTGIEPLGADHVELVLDPEQH